jgi:hypothetical protein
MTTNATPSHGRKKEMGAHQIGVIPLQGRLQLADDQRAKATTRQAKMVSATTPTKLRWNPVTLAPVMLPHRTVLSAE